MALYNPTIKRYQRDQGNVVPNVFNGETEHPRLGTFPAPYLPLQFEMDAHDDHYVVMTGKVVALDSTGFIVPAGLRLQLQTLEDEITAAIGGNLDLSTANADLATLWRYDATDVAAGVKNARGLTVRLNEPVVASFFTDDGVALVQYNEAAANTSTAIPVSGGSVIARSRNVGNHIGLAQYSYLRTASDVLSRAADENPLHPAAASGPAARLPYDPTQLRHLAWEHQTHVGIEVAAAMAKYPVVADRSGVLIQGQAVAIGASLAAFVPGDYVTYNADSDIIPATAAGIVFPTTDFDADVDATVVTRIKNAIVDWHRKIVGQVQRVNGRFPQAYLERVATRWESTVPGFEALDRTSGTATGGKNWEMYAAGSNIGEVFVSPLMR